MINYLHKECVLSDASDPVSMPVEPDLFLCLCSAWLPPYTFCVAIFLACIYLRLQDRNRAGGYRNTSESIALFCIMP